MRNRNVKQTLGNFDSWVDVGTVSRLGIRWEIPILLDILLIDLLSLAIHLESQYFAILRN